jgi:membrane associated rhomboid family serine protease
MPRPRSDSEFANGPSALAVLLLLCAAVHGLRWFAVPLPPGVPPPGALSMAALQNGEWWTCLTHIFIHDSLWHLCGNLLLLGLAGFTVQRAAGQQHAVYIFLLSAWAGSALSIAVYSGSPIVGASGAAMGFAGALSAMFPEVNVLHAIRRWTTVRLRARYLFPGLLLAFLILEILTVRGILGNAGHTQEAHLAHAGGLVAGWLYGRRLFAAMRFMDEGGPLPAGYRPRRMDDYDHALLLAGLAKLPASRGEVRTTRVPVVPPVLTDAEFLAQRVDPVLEKLYSEGAAALTAEEKAILDEASRRFPKHPRRPA